jgi:polysaccharide pyruvyl transferase WcaK-like protein
MIKKKTINVTFSGYYGMKNYGDDLFAITAIQGTNLYWSNIKTKILSPIIKGVNGPYAVPGWFPENVYADFGYIGKISRLGFTIENSLFADKYIFCGGSVFSSNSSGITNILSRIYKKRNNFFSAIGVSIGPFDSIASERKIKNFLKHFEYLALRDQLSFDIAKSFNLDCPIVQAGDLAGLIPDFYPITVHKNLEEPTIKKIGFSPCFLSSDIEKSEKYCNTFIKAITQLQTDINFKIVILNLNEHPLIGDSILCNHVYTELINQNIQCEIINYKENGVLSTWKSISILDAYISVRLHGAVTAYLCNVPFSLFEYHMKCTEFLNDIDQKSFLRITDDSMTIKHLKEIIIHLLEKNGCSNYHTDSYRAKSLLNFTEAPWVQSSMPSLGIG